LYPLPLHDALPILFAKSPTLRSTIREQLAGCPEHKIIGAESRARKSIRQGIGEEDAGSRAVAWGRASIEQRRSQGMGDGMNNLTFKKAVEKAATRKTHGQHDVCVTADTCAEYKWHLAR